MQFFTGHRLRSHSKPHHSIPILCSDRICLSWRFTFMITVLWVNWLKRHAWTGHKSDLICHIKAKDQIWVTWHGSVNVAIVIALLTCGISGQGLCNRYGGGRVRHCDTHLRCWIRNCIWVYQIHITKKHTQKIITQTHSELGCVPLLVLTLPLIH